jgi:hypothetical protein
MGRQLFLSQPIDGLFQFRRKAANLVDESAPLAGRQHKFSPPVVNDAGIVATVSRPAKRQAKPCATRYNA